MSFQTKREVKHEMEKSVIFVVSCGRMFSEFLTAVTNVSVIVLITKLFLELMRNFACNHFVKDEIRSRRTWPGIQVVVSW